MRTVLIITYYFPPLGGAGVQRTLKFVKYLSEFNYLPVILTPDPKLIRYISDDTLIKEIPQGAKVYHSFIVDLNWIFKLLYGLKLNKLVNYINGSLLFPDYQKQWLPFAKNRIKKIMKKEKIDIVYISSPPHSIQKLGAWIKKNFDLPIVSDLRDPLTFNFNRKDFLYKKNFNFEKEIIEDSKTIIVVSPIMKKDYITKFNINKNKIHIIENGYDKSDFTNILKTKKNQNKKIIFTHTGRFYGKYNATSLLLAISTIKSKLEDVEFRFIGKITSTDKKLIKNNSLENFVRIIDYCSHEEALKYNLQSNYLLIILPSSCEYCISGKVFEYMFSNRKILAIVPKNGSCAEIIRRTNTGIVVSPSEIDEIASCILDFIDSKQDIKFDPIVEEIEKYDRKNLTRKLAKVFDNTLSNR